jgi:hypothetical protein
MRRRWIVPGLVMVLVAGCATAPSGPSVLVLPGTGKPFDQFQADDGACRAWAFQQVHGATPEGAAAGSTTATAALGTLAGAVVDAAIGAGGGLVAGSAAGIDAGQRSGSQVQQRYDAAYVQCMYGRGNRVPVSGSLAAAPAPLPPPPWPR